VEAELRVRRVEEELGRAEQSVTGLKQRLVAAKRAAPSTDIAREVLQHRLHTLPARMAAHPTAGREEQLLRVSPAYRDALERGPTVLDGVAHTMELDGLAWHVPLKIGRSTLSDAFRRKQRLPYAGVLRTRELALGGIMLDIGANIGRMAITRAILGDVTLAYCAEPDPITFACLARNVIDNSLRRLVLPDQTAIGARNGPIRLLREGGSGNFRVVEGMTGGNTVEVPCYTLDSWMDRLHIEVDAVTFVKVDVEGYERRVLAGAPRALAARHIAWQMEISPAALRAAGDEPQRLYEDMQQAFTHFIDLSRRVAGARVRRVRDLPDALAYIEPDGKTDVVLFTASGALS
jgi:FkbM family methyltransferase